MPQVIYIKCFVIAFLFQPTACYSLIFVRQKEKKPVFPPAGAPWSCSQPRVG